MRLSPCLTVCAALLILCVPLIADTIRLKNGRSIEGIVTKETETTIFLDLGVGSTSLAKTTIAAVTRSTEDENRKIRAGWKKTYFLHSGMVPEGLEALAAEFKKLVEKRDAAVLARQTLAHAPTDEAGLTADLERIQRQRIETSRRLQEADPDKDLEAYHALVVTNNTLAARYAVKHDERDTRRNSRQTALDQISRYVDSLPALEASLTNGMKAAAQEPGDADRRYFFDRISATLKTYAREFSSATVDLSPAKSGTLVTVLVNDRVAGKFLLDTGAGIVMLSDAFARRLGLDPDGLPSAEFIVADGRKITGRSVILGSMKLGEARAENVEAAILPSGPGADLDGLLGMSFLNRFAVHLDGAGGKLTLKQFTPQ